MDIDHFGKNQTNIEDTVSSLTEENVHSLIRKSSAFPKRHNWKSYVAPEDAVRFLKRGGLISKVAREYFTSQYTNHIDPMGNLFEMGEQLLHRRSGVNTVLIPETVGRQAPLLHSLVNAQGPRLTSLDLDVIFLSDELLESIALHCTGLRSLGVRHFCFSDHAVNTFFSNLHAQSLCELFLAECEMSVSLADTIARSCKTVNTISLSRVRFESGACEDSFWSKVGRTLREIIYVDNEVLGGAARWKSIGVNCKQLERVRYASDARFYNWVVAYRDLGDITESSPREMWFRTQGRRRGLLQPTVVDPRETALEIHAFDNSEECLSSGEWHDNEPDDGVTHSENSHGSIYRHASVYTESSSGSAPIVEEDDELDYLDRLPAVEGASVHDSEGDEDLERARRLRYVPEEKDYSGPPRTDLPKPIIHAAPRLARLLEGEAEYKRVRVDYGGGDVEIFRQKLEDFEQGKSVLGNEQHFSSGLPQWLLPHYANHPKSHLFQAESHEAKENDAFVDAFDVLENVRKVSLIRCHRFFSEEDIALLDRTTELHLDLSWNDATDVQVATEVAGPHLVELLMPRGARRTERADPLTVVHESCVNLRRMRIVDGRERTHAHVEANLRNVGRRLTHLEYWVREGRWRTKNDELKPLRMIAEDTGALRHFIFDCTFVGGNAFEAVAEANPCLRRVLIRVFDIAKNHVTEITPSFAQRVAGWINTFAVGSEMNTICIEQKDRRLDSLPYVDFDEVKAYCSEEVKENKKGLHIQVFSRDLFADDPR